MTTAVNDHLDRIRQRQRAGSLRRRHLADAVTHRKRGPDAHGGESAHARCLDCENQRLGDARSREISFKVGRGQPGLQRPSSQGSKMGVDVSQSFSEFGVPPKGGAAHSLPLGAVSREHEDDRLVTVDRCAPCGGRVDHPGFSEAPQG